MTSSANVLGMTSSDQTIASSFISLFLDSNGFDYLSISCLGLF